MSCHYPNCNRETAGECEKCRKNVVCIVHEFVDVILDGASKVRTTIKLCLACRWNWSAR